MGDLARAIVDLAKAAETRRAARRQLIDATDVVAQAIRKELRTADFVIVPRPHDEEQQVMYMAARVRYVSADGAKESEVLLRDGAVLEQLPSSSRVEDDHLEVHPATAEERWAFVQEAPAVISAFHEELFREARQFEVAAHSATRVVPR
jgi:hypothetical protein